MRSKTVKRFYCDFCGRGMFRADAMLRHEHGCVRNPNRECYRCGAAKGIYDYSTLVAKLRNGLDVTECDFKEGFVEVRTPVPMRWLLAQVDGCPTCALAVLNIGKIYAFGFFDYKASVLEWNREHSVCSM